LEEWLRDSAMDVLKRLAATRDRLSTIRGQTPDVEVVAVVLQ
jgi:hypothetical protein